MANSLALAKMHFKYNKYVTAAGDDFLGPSSHHRHKIGTLA